MYGGGGMMPPEHVYSPFTTILCLSQTCKGLSSRLGQLPVQGGSLCLAMMQQPSARKLPLGGAPAQVPLQVSTPLLPAAWHYAPSLCCMQCAPSLCCMQCAPSLCCMQCALRNSTMHYAVCIMHHAVYSTAMQVAGSSGTEQSVHTNTPCSL